MTYPLKSVGSRDEQGRVLRAARRVSFLCGLIVGVVAVAQPASAGTGVQTLPAAGELTRPAVPVRVAPNVRARRLLVLREFRSDFHPQVILAIGQRTVGAVAATNARATLRDVEGSIALELVARQAGSAGNRLRVTVREATADPAAPAALVVAHPSGRRETYEYGPTDLVGLAAQIELRSRLVTARTVLPIAQLAAVAVQRFGGGANGKPGRLWYELNLPIRPYAQTGWVPATSVAVRPTTHRILVHRAARILEVYRGDRRIFSTRVGVGRTGRPTPLGSFYVTSRFTPATNALVSTYALELSAPAGLSDFPGGGVVGIHGTPATSSIGRAESNGCVRVRPAAALALKRIVPLGTPVQVVR